MTMWRKSSYSDGQGACVELAEVDENVLLRNSTRPTAGTLTLDRAAMAAFVAGCAATEFDDLALEISSMRLGFRRRLRWNR